MRISQGEEGRAMSLPFGCISADRRSGILPVGVRLPVSDESSIPLGGSSRRNKLVNRYRVLCSHDGITPECFFYALVLSLGGCSNVAG